MEADKKDKRKDNSPNDPDQSAIDRIETPFPAQEIFPLDQPNNDGRQRGDVEEVKEEKED